MKRIWLVSSVLMILILAACSNQVSFSPLPVEPAAVLQLVDLATEPVENEHRTVQVGGRYSKLPEPLCNEVLHLPPATWSLSDGGVVIRAAGLENVLNPLVSDGSILIIEGRWLRWHGPVGCGEAAVTSTIWYLEANRILSPNPLVMGESKPSGTDIGIITSQPQTAVPEEESEETKITEQPPEVVEGTMTTLPVGTSTPVPTRVGPQTPTSTATGQFSPLPTPTDPISPLATPDQRLPTLSPPSSPTLNPSVTLLPTFTPEATSTSTPTTDPAGTDQPTATASSTPTNTFTPTPSPSPTDSISANQGYLTIDEVVNGRLLAGASQYWLLNATAGEVITITCGSDSDVDLELTVNDPQGSKIAGRDYTGAGGAETIPSLTLSLSGEYQIVVQEIDGLEGDYGLVVLDSDSINVRFIGNVSYGDSRSTTLPAMTYHLWHFQGNAGDNVNVRLTPNDGSDLVFQFYGPDMSNRIEFVDVSGPGAIEEADFNLTETGFYTIWVEEWDNEASSYELLLTNN